MHHRAFNGKSSYQIAGLRGLAPSDESNAAPQAELFMALIEQAKLKRI